MKFENIFKEWKECRDTIARFDNYLLKIRLVGFSVFTLLFTAITSISNLSKKPDLMSPITIMAAVLTLILFETAIYILDRYYERMLLVSVLRASLLEAVQLEGFKIGLTTEIEFQKTQITKNSFFTKCSRASYMVNFVYMLIFITLGSQFWVLMRSFGANYVYYAVFVVLFIIIMSMIIAAHSLLREPGKLIEARSSIVTSPIVISKVEIDTKVSYLASVVYEWYKKSGKPLNIVTILTGARRFTEDLINSLRAVDNNIKINLHLIRLSNTNDDSCSKDCQWLYGKLDDRSIGGNPTLIVDNLLGSGNTLKKVYDIVSRSNPDEIRTIVLVKKYENAIFEPDFIGFNLTLNQESLYKNKVKEYLLFGYGLGLNGLYREIDHIGWVEVPA